MTAAAAVLFIGYAAFTGATLQPYSSERAKINTKLDVARTAASAISTLWTYTPDDMATLPDRSAVFLGGDFGHEYRNYIDAIVATNKQAQVTNTTQVLGAAVETLTPSEATAIVYTNSVATSPMSKHPVAAPGASSLPRRVRSARPSGLTAAVRAAAKRATAVAVAIVVGAGATAATVVVRSGPAIPRPLAEFEPVDDDLEPTPRSRSP